MNNFKIEDVMNSFDFERVRKVMEFLDWKWFGDKESPSIDMLKSVALTVLETCVNSYEDTDYPQYGMSVSTGGFYAIIKTFTDSSARLSLMFCVENVSHHGYIDKEFSN